MTMTPYERAVAAIMNEPVDELASSPLALGLCRRLMPQKLTHTHTHTHTHTPMLPPNNFLYY